MLKFFQKIALEVSSLRWSVATEATYALRKGKVCFGSKDPRNGGFSKFWSILLFSMVAFGNVGEEAVDSEASNRLSPVVKKANLSQKLGSVVDQNLEFTNEQGNKVLLRQFFGTTPVVLGLVYYKCPGLCNNVMNGLFRTLQKVKLDRGKEFQVVFISINPVETPELALEKKKKYLTTYLHSESEKGIHFLVAKEAQVRALADQIGFKYEYDKNSKQYAHPGVITLLTPQAKVSHYFYGIDFPPKDMQLGLVESSDNKIGSPVDHFLLYCFHYDPSVGRYGLVIMNILKLLGVLTLAGLGIWAFYLSQQNQRKKNLNRLSGGAAHS